MGLINKSYRVTLNQRGGGVVPDVKIAGGDTAALGSAARMAKQPNDAINKATATVRASNATVTLPSASRNLRLLMPALTTCT
jgi:hypothetical protein